MKLSKVVMRFLEKRVWPWKKIAELRERLGYANARISEWERGEWSHREKWMATANMHWGSSAFTGSERVVMERMYFEGMNWKQALGILEDYRGIERNVRRFGV